MEDNSLEGDSGLLKASTRTGQHTNTLMHLAEFELVRQLLEESKIVLNLGCLPPL
jgi:hypothetical protein